MPVFLACLRLEKADMDLVRAVEERAGDQHLEIPCDFCGVMCIADGGSVTHAKATAVKENTTFHVRCHTCTMEQDPNAMLTVQVGDIPTLQKMALEVFGMTQEEFQQVMLTATSIPYREMLHGDD